MFRSFGLVLGLLPLAVQAQVFKCVDPAGHTSYSQVPCPDDGSVSTIMELAPPPAVRPASSVLAPVAAPPQLPAATAGNGPERMRLALDWLGASYPWLDIQSPQADPAAIQQFMLLQNQSVASGADQADALVNAAQLLASQYRGRAPAPAATPAAPAAREPLRRERPYSGGLQVFGVDDEEKAAKKGESREPPYYESGYYQRYPAVYYGQPYPQRPHPPHSHPHEEEEPRKVQRGIPVSEDWKLRR